MNPSSFIPFCEFGGKIKSFGSKIDHFEYPVCNIFESKFLFDQLCYTTDLKKFLDMENLEEEFRIGLILLVDNNEDRKQCCKEASKILNLQFPYYTQSLIFSAAGVHYGRRRFSYCMLTLFDTGGGFSAPPKGKRP